VLALCLLRITAIVMVSAERVDFRLVGPELGGDVGRSLASLHRALYER
jgi:hypothetical protein